LSWEGTPLATSYSVVINNK